MINNKPQIGDLIKYKYFIGYIIKFEKDIVKINWYPSRYGFNPDNKTFNEYIKNNEYILIKKK